MPLFLSTALTTVTAAALASPLVAPIEIFDGGPSGGAMDWFTAENWRGDSLPTVGSTTLIPSGFDVTAFSEEDDIEVVALLISGYGEEAGTASLFSGVGITAEYLEIASLREAAESALGVLSVYDSDLWTSDFLVGRNEGSPGATANGMVNLVGGTLDLHGYASIGEAADGGGDAIGAVNLLNADIAGSGGPTLVVGRSANDSGAAQGALRLENSSAFGLSTLVLGASTGGPADGMLELVDSDAAFDDEVVVGAGSGVGRIVLHASYVRTSQLSLHDGATIEVHVRGGRPAWSGHVGGPDQYGVIEASDAIHLDGTLDVYLESGSVGVGSVLRLLQSQNEPQGAFDAVHVHGLPAGINAKLEVTSQLNGWAVELRVTGAECPADASGDGKVDLDDMLDVMAAWGDGHGPADIDHSGRVDFRDLLDVLSAWGPCN